MDFTIFVPPLLGAVIGYITNDIAIRMLFRPLKAYYIGRWRIPFTPGMIPKEQPRIAASVAHTISVNLLDETALRDALLSEEMLQRVDGAAEGLLQKVLTHEASPEALLGGIVGEEKFAHTLDDAKQRAAYFICQRLYEADVSATLTGMIAEKVKRKMPFLPSSMIAPVQEQIVQWLNEMLMKQCPQILYDVIDREADAYLQKPAGELVAPYEDKLRSLLPKAREAYARTIESALPKILSAIDIEKIIEQKINSFSAAEMERLLRGLMKRELSAIIWLGSLLGFFMGWLNLLFL